MAQTEVTWEDQQRICAFSRMNTRAHEVAAELKALEKRVEDYEEASTELVVNDEDDVSFLLGECFVKMDNESAETRLEKLIQVEKGKLEALKAERRALADGMSELKKVRFANVPCCERRRRRRRRRRLTHDGLLIEIVRQVRELDQLRRVIRMRNTVDCSWRLT